MDDHSRTEPAEPPGAGAARRRTGAPACSRRSLSVDVVGVRPTQFSKESERNPRDARPDRPTLPRVPHDQVGVPAGDVPRAPRVGMTPAGVSPAIAGVCLARGRSKREGRRRAGRTIFDDGSPSATGRSAGASAPQWRERGRQDRIFVPGDCAPLGPALGRAGHCRRTSAWARSSRDVAPARYVERDGAPDVRIPPRAWLGTLPQDMNGGYREDGDP